MIGYAYASRHRERAGYRWSVDISVYVDREWQRRGVGRALYAELLPILRRQGFVNVYAGIGCPEPGQRRTARVARHEADRRVRERRLQVRIVVGRGVVRHAPRRADGVPAEPIPFAELKASWVTG